MKKLLTLLGVTLIGASATVPIVLNSVNNSRKLDKKIEIDITIFNETKDKLKK